MVASWLGLIIAGIILMVVGKLVPIDPRINYLIVVLGVILFLIGIVLLIYMLVSGMVVV